ncbi:CMP-sialic acid transporter 2-like protein [Tanacetum coccineum]
MRNVTRSTLEDGLKRVEDIVPQTIGCQDIVHVSCDGTHSIALTRDGRMFSTLQGHTAKAAHNNVLLAVPAFFYAINNYLKFTMHVILLQKFF